MPKIEDYMTPDDWKESKEIKNWDYKPLEIMEYTFPNIKSTQWYHIRLLQVSTKTKVTTNEI